DVDAAAAASKSSPTALSKEKREPLSRMRRAIGERMTKSVREQPQFSISRDVDMTVANEKRKAAGASYTDAIVAAAAKTLREHPRLRARLDGGELVTSDAANIGLAIALEDGLVVAVVRDADRKSLEDLAAQRGRLEGLAPAVPSRLGSRAAPGDARGRRPRSARGRPLEAAVRGQRDRRERF